MRVMVAACGLRRLIYSSRSGNHCLLIGPKARIDALDEADENFPGRRGVHQLSDRERRSKVPFVPLIVKNIRLRFFIVYNLDATSRALMKRLSPDEPRAMWSSVSSRASLDHLPCFRANVGEGNPQVIQCPQRALIQYPTKTFKAAPCTRSM
jgi:hypothetical protein